MRRKPHSVNLFRNARDWPGPLAESSNPAGATNKPLTLTEFPVLARIRQMTSRTCARNRANRPARDETGCTVMTDAAIEVDYLIVGAGAAGMAFADTLLGETEASVAIVDRQFRPGGHWNDAYPFVRLHQPASYYGVNSRELGSGRSTLQAIRAGRRPHAARRRIPSTALANDSTKGRTERTD
jgi:NAD(P)-binding Rossmann-like domain